MGQFKHLKSFNGNLTKFNPIFVVGIVVMFSCVSSGKLNFHEVTTPVFEIHCYFYLNKRSATSKFKVCVLHVVSLLISLMTCFV